MADNNAQGRQLLLDLEEEAKNHVRDHLARTKLLPAEKCDALAESLAKHLADWLALSWGGQQVYLPKDNQRRAALIWQEFDGNNVPELASKYGVCIHTIYRIIKREREARQLRQGSLLEL